MQPANTPHCGICQEPYNDSNRAPRAVCTNYHNICSECLGEMLKKAIGDKILCPFDRLELDKKPLSGFPVNIELLNFIQPANDQSIVSRKNCSSCPDEATRLCLECNEIQCNTCILENHEEHKKVKLTDAPKMLTEKKNKLSEEVARLEGSISGEGAKRYVEVKGNELKEEANAIFDDFQRVLDDKKESVINEIQKKLAEISSSYVIKKKPQKNNKKNDEISKWINETKSLTENGNNRMIDNNSVLCNLYKQERLLKRLDISDLEAKETKEDLLLIQVLNQLTLQVHALSLENFKKSHPVKFEENKFEEVKFEASSSRGSAQKPTNATRSNNSFSSMKDPDSEISDSHNNSLVYQSKRFINSQERDSLSPRNSQDQSDWIKTGSKPEKDPLKEEMNQLKKAFRDADLKVEVQPFEGSNTIRLDSINEKTNSAYGGLKEDEELQAFYHALCKKTLSQSLKRITSLNLTCIRTKESGALYLAKIVDSLPFLEDLRVDFFHSQGLKHEHLNPLMKALGRSKNLTNLSLSCQKWIFLQNFNLAYTICDLASINNLKNLTLNFSGCLGLTTVGIMEAFHWFSSFEALENLKISFNECNQVKDDEHCLESIHHVYSEMENLQMIEFDFLNCPGFTERGKKALRGSLRGNAGPVVKINRK